MNNLFEYLIQSGVCLAVFYSFYWFLLRNDTFFRLNRFYLLTSIIISLTAPLIKIQIPGNVDSTAVFWLDEIVVTPSGITNYLASSISSVKILLIIYITGVLIMTIRLFYQLLQVLILMTKAQVRTFNNNLLFVSSSDYAPFSLLNLVFISKNLNDEDGLANVLAHEKVHIRQFHTIDLIIAEILAIVQWFNPFVWMLKHSMKMNHEFLADNGVLEEGYNRSNYQQLLLNSVFGMQINTLTNNFNQSLIKKRLTMMTKTKTRKLNLLKMAFIGPMAILIAIFFSLTISEKVVAQESIKQPASQTVSDEPDKDQIFVVVEQMPKYPGGDDARIKYIVENIKYPPEAREKGVQGTVFITFVIEKDGSVGNAKVLRGIGSGCDEEALRVIKNMPDWIPGKQRGKPVRVQFNMPVKFNLDKKTESDERSKGGTVPPPPQTN